MIEDRIGKAHGVVADAAVLHRYRVIGRHADCADTVIAVMAICTGLRHRVDQ